MSEHYCQFSAQVPKGSKWEFWSIYNEQKCCGAIARFVIYRSYWLCAEHFDLMISYCPDCVYD